jgi:hypothetical protein
VLLEHRSRHCAIPLPRSIDPETFGRLVKSDTIKHTVLYLSARMYAAELGSSLGRVPREGCLAYKHSAIQRIRSVVKRVLELNENGPKEDDVGNHGAGTGRIASCLRHQLTDEDVLAVVFMAMSYNQALDGLHEFRNHIDGASRMVRLRGGAEGLGYDGLIMDLYEWSVRHCEVSVLCQSFAADI